MKKKLVVANWKMNPLTAKEAEMLCRGYLREISGFRKIEVVVCAPFLFLERVKKISKKISLGAQDVFQGDVGPFTGEVSAEMLYELGARYVIVGHSERRKMGEENFSINQKLKGAVAAGVSPILCVGELERDENHLYFNDIKTQLEEGLQGVSKTALSKIIVAYEPIWAISTTSDRRNASPEDSREMAVFIRKILSSKFGAEGGNVRILYGGSVNEKDAEGFIKDGGVDGLLVGKASLAPSKFGQILKLCEASGK